MQIGDVEDVYPLSPAQQGILFHTLYEQKAGVYVTQLHCVIEGAFDPELLVRAWSKASQRHAVLRSSALWEGLKQSMLVVWREPQIPVARLDWRDISQAEQDQRLEQFLEHDRERGFELSKAPLMRLTIIEQAPERLLFVWT